MSNFADQLKDFISAETKKIVREELASRVEQIDDLLKSADEATGKIEKILDRDVSILEIERVLSETEPGNFFSGATNAALGSATIHADAALDYVEVRCSGSGHIVQLRPIKSRQLVKGEYTALLLLYKTS